jgi:hypothetical protein
MIWMIGVYLVFVRYNDYVQQVGLCHNVTAVSILPVCITTSSFPRNNISALQHRQLNLPVVAYPD